jgi:T4 RnlA family RNA ligase
MRLVNSSEAFFYNDHKKEGKWFRIFNYRLASYTDFLLPNALECRGHMFEISEEGKNAKPVSFVSHQFPKFFNYQENPFTADVQFSDVVEIAVKMDGSLISTFMLNDEVHLKTKGSLVSTQAFEAAELLNSVEYSDLKQEIEIYEQKGYTVLMEFCGPSNRIVIGYEKPMLTVLGVRSRVDGHFLFCDKIESLIFQRYWTSIVHPFDVNAFLQKAKGVINIEGYVCRLKTGQLFKIKGLKYVALHHTKDSINSPRRLFEAVLEEATDDMKSLFHDDPLAIKQIEEMEAFVESKYNHLVDVVERFYERNKHLERKDYAILGQKELPSMFFGLAMNKYVNREVDYKMFLKGQWKKLGISDTTTQED